MTSTLDGAAQWREVISRKYFPTIALLSMAVWLHAANSMLTATTLPSAVEEIGGLHLVSWAFALYLLGSIMAAAAVSLFVVKHGLKATMQSAAVVYGIGCIICASAPMMEILLIGRTLQGLGGGALVALAYISQNRLFPNHFIPKIVAVISIVWMTSALCGPFIGGALATVGLWRWAFWSFALQTLCLMIAIYFLLKAETPALAVKKERIPWVRLCALAVAILSISLAGTGLDILPATGLTLLGCLALGIFLVRDKNATSSRMLPRETTNFNHDIGNGIAMTFTFCLSIMSLLVYGPLILIQLYDLTPLAAGFIVMVETLAWGVAAVLFSGINPSRDHILIRSGGFLVVTGLLCQALFLPHGPLWAVVISAAVGSGGFGMMWGFIIRRIAYAADEEEKDKAASLLPTAQQLGFALGAALSGLIANGFGLSETISREGMKLVAFWVFAGFVPVALLGNVFAWRFTQRSRPTLTLSDSG